MVSPAHLDAFDRVDRCTQDGQMRCKKGKPCNGRCIPKTHKCGVDTPGSEEFEGRTRSAQKIRNGVGAGILVGGLAAATVLNSRSKQNHRKTMQGLTEAGQQATQRINKQFAEVDAQIEAQRQRRQAFQEELKNRPTAASRNRPSGSVVRPMKPAAPRD